MKVIAPIAVLLSCIAIFALLWVFKAEPKEIDTIESYPEVRVVLAEAGERRLTLHADGELRARTNTIISAEVRGKVISVSENFAAGGYFAPSDVLLEIDVTADEFRREALAFGIREIALTGDIGIAAVMLEGLHRDPADRIIVATALANDATLITADRRLLGWAGLLKRHDARL